MRSMCSYEVLQKQPSRKWNVCKFSPNTTANRRFETSRVHPNSNPTTPSSSPSSSSTPPEIATSSYSRHPTLPTANPQTWTPHLRREHILVTIAPMPQSVLKQAVECATAASSLSSSSQPTTTTPTALLQASPPASPSTPKATPRSFSDFHLPRLTFDPSLGASLPEASYEPSIGAVSSIHSPSSVTYSKKFVTVNLSGKSLLPPPQEADYSSGDESSDFSDAKEDLTDSDVDYFDAE